MYVPKALYTPSMPLGPSVQLATNKGHKMTGIASQWFTGFTITTLKAGVKAVHYLSMYINSQISLYIMNASFSVTTYNTFFQ